MQGSRGCAVAATRAVEPQADGWSVQPQRIKHHRTGGDVLKGLGALLVLVILLGAIPFALVRYIGWPLPHQMPSSDIFNQPITPQVLLNALAVIVWLAWAQFAACVLVESCGECAASACRRACPAPVRASSSHGNWSPRC